MTKKLIRGGLVVDGTGKRSGAVLRKKASKSVSESPESEFCRISEKNTLKSRARFLPI